MRIGLRLRNSVAGILAVELQVFAAGLPIYLRSTQEKDRVGILEFLAFAAFLLAIYDGATLGPPPLSANVVARSDMGQWLVILWVGWVDGHRIPFPTNAVEGSL